MPQTLFQVIANPQCFAFFIKKLTFSYINKITNLHFMDEMYFIHLKLIILSIEMTHGLVSYPYFV